MTLWPYTIYYMFLCFFLHLFYSREKSRISKFSINQSLLSKEREIISTIHYIRITNYICSIIFCFSYNNANKQIGVYVTFLYYYVINYLIIVIILL